MIPDSDIILVLSRFHSYDVCGKVGGFHTDLKISDISDIDGFFQPGICLESEASDDYYIQYRKVFLKNKSDTQNAKNVAVFGFNVKRTNIVGMALEKNAEGRVIIDGSDCVKNYRTAPGILEEYDFSEIYSDDARLVGGDGLLPAGSAQGLWLRMKIDRGISEDAFDQFSIGVTYTEDD